MGLPMVMAIKNRPEAALVLTENTVNFFLNEAFHQSL